MSTDVTQLAKLMRERKEARGAPYILLLGSSLSLTPEVRRAVSESDDWTDFWQTISRRSVEERRAALREPLLQLGLQAGYDALARLLGAGYFGIVLTLNIDDALDNALRMLPAGEYHIWVHGTDRAAEISAALDRAAPPVKVIKLRGDINIYELPLTPEASFEFPDELEDAITALLSRDILIIGDLPHDYDVQRCLKRSGGALWIMQPREAELSDFLNRAKRRRERGELIAAPNFNDFFTALADALDLYEDSKRVGAGLTALTELMDTPEVRAAVVAFRTDFRAANARIEEMSVYKELHDLLHRLQFHCYNGIVQEAARFPNDEMAFDNLMDYELTLQNIIGDLRNVIADSEFGMSETAWIEDLVKAQVYLRGALDAEDGNQLKKTIWLLNRVLAVQPAQINTRLNTAARVLRLPNLVDALTRVRDSLVGLELAPAEMGKIQQFETGVTALAALNHSLAKRVEEHDQWQVVDLELRRIEAVMGQDMLELEMSWADLKTKTEQLLYGDSTAEWVIAFKADSDNLGRAITEQNPARVKRYFRRYRRRAGDRFYRVDMELKKLCEDLRQIGEPLTAVMRVIE